MLHAHVAVSVVVYVRLFPLQGGQRVLDLVIREPELTRLRRGNLSTKSLASVVDPKSIIQDSEFRRSIRTFVSAAGWTACS
jgi:hypothetical protein